MRELLASSGTEGISSGKIEEFLQSAMESCDSRAEGTGGIKEVVKEWLTAALMTMTDLAQVVNEVPVMPKEKVFWLWYEIIVVPIVPINLLWDYCSPQLR